MFPASLAPIVRRRLPARPAEPAPADVSTISPNRSLSPVRAGQVALAIRVERGNPLGPGTRWPSACRAGCSRRELPYTALPSARRHSLRQTCRRARCPVGCRPTVQLVVQDKLLLRPVCRRLSHSRNACPHRGPRGYQDGRCCAAQPHRSRQLPRPPPRSSRPRTAVARNPAAPNWAHMAIDVQQAMMSKRNQSSLNSSSQ